MRIQCSGVFTYFTLQVAEEGFVVEMMPMTGSTLSTWVTLVSLVVTVFRTDSVSTVTDADPVQGIVISQYAVYVVIFYFTSIA